LYVNSLAVLIRSIQRLILIITFTSVATLAAISTKAQDSTRRRSDSVRYPIKDRIGDPFTYNLTNPFTGSDTSFVKRDIQYDPKTKQYYIVEKIGNSYYRTPTFLTYDEMLRLKAKQDETEYFRKRANTLSVLNRKVERPKLKTYDRLFDRIFGVGPGGLKVDIRPQGNVDIMAGYQGQ
jgi:hypothetical protein